MVKTIKLNQFALLKPHYLFTMSQVQKDREKGHFSMRQGRFKRLSGFTGFTA